MSDIHNLFEMLDYKTDSIASKTLVEKGGGSVTLYAFDKAQGLGEHSSPFVTLLQLVEGKAEIRIDNRNSLMRDGDVVTILADIPYSLHAIHKVKALVFRINSSLKKSE
jgi:quercetin dioxygenase-like cupin family protein